MLISVVGWVSIGTSVEGRDPPSKYFFRLNSANDRTLKDVSFNASFAWNFSPGEKFAKGPPKPSRPPTPTDQQRTAVVPKTLSGPLIMVTEPS